MFKKNESSKNKPTNLFIRILIYIVIFFLIPAIFISSNCFIPKISLYGQTLEEQLQSIKDEKEANQKKLDEANKKEQELNQINNELNAKAQILNKRVALIYENRGGNILEILFKTKDFIDLISKLKMLNLIAKQDAKIVQEVKDKKDANLVL